MEAFDSAQLQWQYIRGLQVVLGGVEEMWEVYLHCWSPLRLATSSGALKRDSVHEQN